MEWPTTTGDGKTNRVPERHIELKHGLKRQGREELLKKGSMLRSLVESPSVRLHAHSPECPLVSYGNRRGR